MKYALHVRYSVGLLIFTVAGPSGAQSVSTSQPSAPLGLLRLNDTTKPGAAARLDPTKFSVDNLPTDGAAGASKARNSGTDYTAVSAGSEYSRPLRGTARDATFTSFQVYGSQTTIFEIAGARLGLTAGPISESLQLMYDDSTTGALQWKSLNLHVPTAKYAGRTFAALPVLTVLLDPITNTWTLFSGGRLLADHLPLIAAKRDNRQFTVKAGTEGAWIVGLVLADENPLYEDANANGIDDVFERKRHGVILPVTATLAERQLLAKEWKDAQRAKAPPALYMTGPTPDGTGLAPPTK